MLLASFKDDDDDSSFGDYIKWGAGGGDGWCFILFGDANQAESTMIGRFVSRPQSPVGVINDDHLMILMTGSRMES